MSKMLYSVHSWWSPKRMSGSWPAGMVSASLDAESARDAAEQMIKVIGPARMTKKRAIEVESYYGKVTSFMLSTSGTLTERRARKSHGARKRAYKGR